MADVLRCGGRGEIGAVDNVKIVVEQRAKQPNADVFEEFCTFCNQWVHSGGLLSKRESSTLTRTPFNDYFDMTTMEIGGRGI